MLGAAAVVQGLGFPVTAPPRTLTVRRAEDEKSDERTTGERLAPVEETLSAFVVGAVAAAGAGVEILDAGAVSSALLAGALVGFAAENENQYGFGMLARGLVRSRRPAVRRRLHAIDARRLQERRPWVVSFSISRPFGPRRASASIESRSKSEMRPPTSL